MQQDAGISAIGQLISIILHNFNCTWVKLSYFYFWSKIWYCHHVPSALFPNRCKNFGDSHTFKAGMRLLILAWIFKTYWLKIGGFSWGGAKYGKGWCDVDSQWTHFYFWVFYLCQFWWKSIKKCDHESAYQMERQMHRHKSVLQSVPCYMLQLCADNNLMYIIWVQKQCSTTAGLRNCCCKAGYRSW